VLLRIKLAVVAAADGSADQSADKSGKDRPGDQPAERPAYEHARDELTDLVKRLEAGGLTLEQSLQLWERGEELAAICEEWLEGARARLATAMAKQDTAGPTPGAPF
jgi:exodeoxyribonuclease VII small subunit